ncbi:hypothetical protein LCG56_27455 (plasmid) [Pseudomonas cannabina pv. alisalensis]|uniref:Uncharacterized protein n=1 Tax=Pseudomonas syringae pv. maculicola str. ES4326 TaxID=629265 RepID=A0A8T8CA88_PSEYM|nr:MULTISPECIES: hypothetical protein [Pseudomonas syringae group]QHF00521.1 hypothetical protein PMA4326_028835 [Pseudomonas syringae pv. maculicola str. ES4326]UBZ00501.1 hypothetical protein LCG56_27455 [Pseudomonas cannabina pv. alisalensis]
MPKTPLDDFLEFIKQKHGEETWVSLYKRIFKDDKSEDGGFYSALVSQSSTEVAIKQPSWDLMLGGGGPGFVTGYENDEEVTKYLAQSDSEYRRIVLCREFHGRKDDYFEISEEFRLFHNLYFDQKSSIYVTFDDAGDEIEVIKILPSEIKVRKGYLRSFMAATQTNLLLYFEVTRHFTSNNDYQGDIKSEDLCIVLYSGQSYSDGFSYFTRALGKKLIRCDAIEKSGIWPFTAAKKYEDFIIGGDLDAPVVYICNPDELANYFGANPHAPHYLTPVFFKKEVMQKYYGSSDYEISDGHLSRKGSWSLRFDNNASGHVSVFLGDLGRDLPSKEQIYWKSFNLIPDGHSISETNYQRSFLGNFYDPESPEHQFKYAFVEVQKACSRKFGWSIFLPLADKDTHYLNSIRSMLTCEQSEFDALILAVAKITIDSVNVKDLRKHLGQDDESKSIVLLGLFLQSLNIQGHEEFSTFLRGVQSVRSSGVAHRKGTEYDKVIARLNIDKDNYQGEFNEILLKFVSLFEAIVKAP